MTNSPKSGGDPLVFYIDMNTADVSFQPKPWAMFVTKDEYDQALKRIEKLRAALEGFKLGHEHAPDLPHTRAMGDTYGWCDYCQTKVSWGPGDAEQALAADQGDKT